MRALTWHGKRDVRVEDVPDPQLLEPTDAIVKITSTGLCGSDLHLYEVLGPFLSAGDVLERGVDEQPPAGGQADRRDPAVLHPGLLHRSLHRMERGLADVESPLDEVVDVGTGVGPHDAGGHPLLAGPRAGDDDAVPARGERDVVRLGHRGGVGEPGVDRHDGHLLRAGPGGERSSHGRRHEVRAVGGRHRGQGGEAGQGHPVIMRHSRRALRRPARERLADLLGRLHLARQRRE